MGKFKFRISQKEKRRWSREFLEWTESMCSGVSVGQGFRETWTQTEATFEESWSSSTLDSLSLPPSLDTLGAMKRVVDRHPLESVRLWFSILIKLVQEGSELAPTLEAMVRELRSQRKWELETYLRDLPTRVNLRLMLLLLPPTLLILVLPVLTQLIQSLKL